MKAHQLKMLLYLAANLLFALALAHLDVITNTKEFVVVTIVGTYLTSLLTLKK